MKGILVYQPPDKPAQLPEFIDSLDPRLREKIIYLDIQISDLIPRIELSRGSKIGHRFFVER